MTQADGRLALLGLALVLAALLGLPAPAGAADVYVTDLDGAVLQFTIPGNHRLEEKHPPSVRAPEYASEIAVTPDGRYVYVVDSGISQYKVTPDGTLAPNGAVSAGLGPQGIAIAPNGRSLYVANGRGGTVSQYSIESDGQLTPLNPATVRSGGAPYGIAVSPDGDSVYVTQSGIARDLYQYTVAHSGKLTPKQPPTHYIGGGPSGIAVAPDSKSAYVAISADNVIGQYDIDANGELSSKTPPAVTTGPHPHDIAVSPDGGSAYVTTDEKYRGLWQYTIAANGTLSPKSPATLTTSGRAVDIAVSPDGHSAYSTTEIQYVDDWDVAPDGSLVHIDSTFAGTRPYGVAIRPDLPSRSRLFSIRGLRLNRPRGTAHLRVAARTSGRFVLSGNRVRRQAKHVRHARTLKIRVWPKPAARRSLRRTGTARVRIKVAFHSSHGPVATKRRTVTLVKSG